MKAQIILNVFLIYFSQRMCWEITLASAKQHFMICADEVHSKLAKQYSMTPLWDLTGGNKKPPPN